MKANNRFINKEKEFWANVRLISQKLGYTKRKRIIIHSVEAIAEGYSQLGLNKDKIKKDGKPTKLGQDLHDYFSYRAEILNNQVEPLLMGKDEAQRLFNEYRNRLAPKCPLPMNKQKKEKRNFAFLTCLVNMIIEENKGNIECDYDPRLLTSVTDNGIPIRTMSRRVDGAFPSTTNPIAIWEIKEYYYTTTFGSRVADGVYETLLDGMELEELEKAGHKKIHHTLIIDDHYTWWECGSSYLCRIIDMLNMGYVDEVLFGKEVVDRLPELVKKWREEAK